MFAFFQGNLPFRYEHLGPLFLKNAGFYPRTNGANAYDSEWSRNKYSFNGTYYHVYVRLKPGLKFNLNFSIIRDSYHVQLLWVKSHKSL